MLLWEALAGPQQTNEPQKSDTPQTPVKTVRLPFDMRCSVVTKSGRRCRGRIRSGSDVCALHDPAVAQKSLSGGQLGLPLAQCLDAAL